MGILDVARKSFARLKAGQNGHAKPPYMAPAVAKACAATLRKYDKNDINDKSPLRTPSEYPFVVFVVCRKVVERR